MHLAESTVSGALKRFERDGCRFKKPRLLNFSKAWDRNRKIKKSVAAYLLSYDCLTKWAGMSLLERVKEL